MHFLYLSTKKPAEEELAMTETHETMDLVKDPEKTTFDFLGLPPELRNGIFMTVAENQNGPLIDLATLKLPALVSVS